jgi:Fe2+ or Zn2+ uptake regulation protein
MPISPEQVEPIVRAHIKGTGQRLHFGTRSKVVVQALWAATRPTSVVGLLYAVKKLDPQVSQSTVANVLELLGDSGVAKLVEGDGKRHHPWRYQAIKTNSRPNQHARLSLHLLAR